MAEENEIHLDDIGTIFEVTIVEDSVAVNISTATVKEIRFKKTGGAVVVKTAEFTTDGTDGKIQYVGILDDIDQKGHWKLQGYIEMPSWKGYSSIGGFEVFENL